MDMQNVSNLQMPEGMVRTIHDKNNQLLWGAVGYDTKYAGDTLQNGAPTPDAPIPVQVVTGEQTVTTGDGVSSQSYTVNLGSTELCKINNYQDYVYKSGDDWYLHKEIGKAVLNGSENWSSRTNLSATLQMTAPITSEGILDGNIQKLCNYGRYSNSAYNYGGIGDFNVLYNTKAFLIGVATGTTVSSFQSMLSTNNLITYYPLATPTDTKITDSVLISQLNAIHKWLIRYGYNAVVSGNLPIIIDRTNL